MPSAEWWPAILLACGLLSFVAAVAIWAAGAINRDPECKKCGSREVDLGKDEHGDWWWKCQTCGYCWPDAKHQDADQAEPYR